jgi:CDP-6-deoxy-D-xylo-4-hexulose-3-dehydrase
MLGRNFRVSGELTVTDKIMHDTFWIGVWPGLGEEHLGHVARCLEQFFGLPR